MKITYYQKHVIEYEEFQIERDGEICDYRKYPDTEFEDLIWKRVFYGNGEAREERVYSRGHVFALEKMYRNWLKESKQ